MITFFFIGMLDHVVEELLHIIMGRNKKGQISFLSFLGF